MWEGVLVGLLLAASGREERKRGRGMWIGKARGPVAVHLLLNKLQPPLYSHDGFTALLL